jgi:hypothetical protein
MNLFMSIIYLISKYLRRRVFNAVRNIFGLNRNFVNTNHSSFMTNPCNVLAFINSAQYHALRVIGITCITCNHSMDSIHHNYKR